MSGVIFTRELEYGSPYIIINYSTHSDKAHAVTSGCSDGVKTIVVYKYGDIQYNNSDVQRLINLVKELEHSTNFDSLDIEFAIDKNDECFLFQVRPLVSQLSRKKFDDRDFILEKDSIKAFMSNLMQRRPHLFGEKTILGIMPDWNPAEIIGTAPRPLALTLYQYLITDTVWGKSRFMLGYKDTYPEPLVVSLAGRPYVDTRASFNSFLPVGLSPELSERLVNYYLERLENNPKLFDKVEFEIALTCMNFDFDNHVKNLINAGFKQSSINEIRASLLKLTNGILNEKDINFENQLRHIAILAERRNHFLSQPDNSSHGILRTIRYLLDDCVQFGTLPFSILARFAFIGTSFLRSLQTSGVLSRKDYDDFSQTIPTVASEVSEAISKVVKGDIELNAFLDKYGHLRPGTYDILSPRYDEAPDVYILSEPQVNNKKFTKSKIGRNAKEIILEKQRSIDTLLRKNGIICSAENLADFIYRGIQAREYAKFEFTKNLSGALKLLARFGETMKISIDDISLMPIHYFTSLSTNSSANDIKRNIKMNAGRNKKRYAITRAIQLPPLICSSQDLDYFHYEEMQPNFITSKKVIADIFKLDSICNEKVNLKNKIILIENADPGYDWIFGHEIAGLISKYGGVASHMTIRAAEFGLPAAIGCGELIFQKLLHASKIELNCATKQIHIVR